MDASTRITTRLDSWKEIAAYLKRGARTAGAVHRGAAVCRHEPGVTALSDR
jgi:hypothetical protein